MSTILIKPIHRGIPAKKQKAPMAQPIRKLIRLYIANVFNIAPLYHTLDIKQ